MLERNQIRLEKHEVEIECQWLLDTIRRNFKFIMVMAIVMSLLLPVGKFFVDNEFNSYHGNVEEVSLTKDELLTVEKYQKISERVEYLEEYKENSLLMNLDYKNVSRATVQYFVSGDDAYTKDIVDALTYYVKTGAYATKLSEMMDISNSKTLMDLISVKSIEDDDNEHSNILCVEVCYFSESECKDLVDKFTKVLVSYTESLSSSIGENSLVLLNENYDDVYSESIYTKQKDIIAQVETVKIEKKTLNAQLTDVQKNYLLQENDGSGTTQEATTVKSFDYVYLIIGFIVGAGLAIMLVLGKKLFDGRIHSENEMKKRFGINNWGGIKNELLNGSEHDFAIVERIRVYLNNNNIEKLLITGTNETVIQRMCDEFNKNNIKTAFVDLHSLGSKTVEELEEYGDAIALVSVGQDEVKQFYMVDDIFHCLDIEWHGYVTIPSQK